MWLRGAKFAPLSTSCLRGFPSGEREGVETAKVRRAPGWVAKEAKAFSVINELVDCSRQSFDVGESSVPKELIRTVGCRPAERTVIVT